MSETFLAVQIFVNVQFCGDVGKSSPLLSLGILLQINIDSFSKKLHLNYLSRIPRLFNAAPPGINTNSGHNTRATPLLAWTRKTN